MRRVFRWIFVFVCVGFVAIQFVHPEKNQSLGSLSPEDLRTLHPIPEPVRKRLEVGCYDCHSNHTRYPWYSQVQPFAWWLDQHIRDGKRELNLSTFGRYPAKRQVDKLESIIDALNDRSMPLRSYTWTHRDAIFTDEESKEIVAWAEALRDKLEEDLE